MTSSTTVGTTQTRTLTSAVRPPLLPDLQLTFGPDMIGLNAVFQRASVDAAVLNSTSAPGASVLTMTLIGASKQAALQQLARGHPLTTL